MRQIEVTILGQSYMLGCPPGGEARLSTAVSVVDREMGMIRDTGKIKARERIAVLAALNLAYRMDPGIQPTSSQPPPADDQSGQGRTQAEAQATIDSLVARLDAALSEDGHLL
jgi:cell division protein ZapA